VPAVPRGLDWAADMKAGWSEAALRADRASDRIRQLGLELEEVIVGDPDPFAAVGDVLHAREFDEVVVSTLPRTISRWLAVGLPARLRRTVDLPVSEVNAKPLAEPLPARSAGEPVAAATFPDPALQRGEDPVLPASIRGDGADEDQLVVAAFVGRR
jgi:hypothetical protein